MEGLTPDILLRAYAAGIFPMAESAEDSELFWVDPERRGVFHHLVRADAGIDADDQLHAVLRGFLHHFAFHSIAIENAVGDVTRGPPTGEFDGGFQNDQSTGAVDIVIAVSRMLSRFWTARAKRPAASGISASRKGSCRSAQEGERNLRADAESP